MKNILVAIFVLAVVLIFSGCQKNQNESPASVGGSFELSEILWKSSDGGENWEAKNKGEGRANVNSGDILSLAVSASTDEVYAGLRKGGIIKSVNGGETWSFANFQSEKVYGLAMGGNAGKTLYASGVWQETGKLFSSEDKGENWKELYSSPSEGLIIISLAVDKKNSQFLYIGTSNKEVMKTENGGETWKNVYLSESPILKIVIDSIDNNLVYLLAQSGKIFRSTSGGKEFEDISEKLTKDFSQASGSVLTVLESDPIISKKLFAAGAAGIFVSKNAGDKWEKITTLNDPKTYPVMALAVSPGNSNEIIYGASGAVMKSKDGGVSWKTYQFKKKAKVKVLQYDSENFKNIFLGFSK